jgi:hypothetical protein
MAVVRRCSGRIAHAGVDPLTGYVEKGSRRRRVDGCTAPYWVCEKRTV